MALSFIFIAAVADSHFLPTQVENRCRVYSSQELRKTPRFNIPFTLTLLSYPFNLVATLSRNLRFFIFTFFMGRKVKESWTYLGTLGVGRDPESDEAARIGIWATPEL